jgi:hypothetical protein
LFLLAWSNSEPHFLLAETNLQALEGKCDMRAITIEAMNVGPARGLYNALIEFHPELAGSDDKGYGVSVELGSGESRLLDVLGAIEHYVTEASRGPTRIDVDGRGYTMHAVVSSGGD